MIGIGRSLRNWRLPGFDRIPRGILVQFIGRHELHADLCIVAPRNTTPPARRAIPVEDEEEGVGQGFRSRRSQPRAALRQIPDHAWEADVVAAIGNPCRLALWIAL